MMSQLQGMQLKCFNFIKQNLQHGIILWKAKRLFLLLTMTVLAGSSFCNTNCSASGFFSFSFSDIFNSSFPKALPKFGLYLWNLLRINWTGRRGVCLPSSSVVFLLSILSQRQKKINLKLSTKACH